MRSYIFTDAEKKILINWLTGRITRSESTLLHTTLGRLRRGESSLIKDFKLFSLAVRKLRLGPKPRMRNGEPDLTFIVTPIQIRIPKKEKQKHMWFKIPLTKAYSIANDENLPSEHRLRAIEIAVQLSRALMENREPPKYEEIEAELEKLKKQTERMRG